MAIALAPRVYGLDAICAAALKSGDGEEAAFFTRRLFARVADKDLAAAPAEQRAAAAIALLAFARRRLSGVAKVRVFNASLADHRSEEHTSELQSRPHLVCRLLLEKKKPHTGYPGDDRHKIKRAPTQPF